VAGSRLKSRDGKGTSSHHSRPRRASQKEPSPSTLRQATAVETFTLISVSLFVHADGDAAIGDDIGADDEARLVRGEQRRDGGDLLGPAEAPDRLARLDLGAR